MNACVKCGYCCTICACPFGTWSIEKKQCEFLTKANECSKYEEIIKNPESEFAPAFGAGCCASLFNERRQRKIEELARSLREICRAQLQPYNKEIL